MIERLLPERAGVSELERVYALHREVEAELTRPELIPPLAQFGAELRHPPSYEVNLHWVARDRDQLVGWATLWYEERPSNRHLAWLEVEVAPGHRGEGWGRRLAEEAVGAAAGASCTVLGIDARCGAPGEGFASHLGLTRRYVERASVLERRDLDPALLQRWMDAAPERAAEYELVGWAGPCPDEWLDRFVTAQAVMNTAPMEELDYDDEVYTPDLVRESERSWALQDTTPVVLMAVHRPSGEVAGFTAVQVLGRWPEMLQQGDTGVWPKHRNRGLGRWLKAAMLQQVLAASPRIERVFTGNAGSNRPMLAINEALGFKPAEYWATYQGPLPTARD